jgi:hypothetical protein
LICQFSFSVFGLDLISFPGKIPGMKSNITPLACTVVSSKTRTIRRFCIAAATGLALAAANDTFAQISTINGIAIKPRVFDDIPSATLITVTNDSTVIFNETNVTSSTGFANRDVWYFSADGGSTPYLFQSNDYFSASFKATITGGTPGKDIEAGFLFSDPSGNFGGDLQIIATGSGVVFQGGGPSYYPFSPLAGGFPGKGGSVANYVEGRTYTFGLNFVQDPNTGLDAFQYSVNGQYAASAPNNTYFDLGAGQFIGSPGDFLGGYFQIQTVSNNPANAGLVVFQDISIGPPVIANVPFNVAENGNQSVIYWPPGSTNFVVQTSLDLTNWTTITNGTPVAGISVTNTSQAGFFRLQYQP